MEGPSWLVSSGSDRFPLRIGHGPSPPFPKVHLSYRSLFYKGRLCRSTPRLRACFLELELAI
eukprot:IDg2231t1